MSLKTRIARLEEQQREGGCSLCAPKQIELLELTRTEAERRYGPRKTNNLYEYSEPTATTCVGCGRCYVPGISAVVIVIPDGARMTDGN